MNISSLKISDDKTTLDLIVEDAANLVDIRFWNDKTYKDYTRIVNLNSKKTGADTENITITLADIEESYFDGVYFIEVEDDTTTSIEFTYAFDRYKECLLEKIITLSTCDDCLEEVSNNIINAQTLYDALIYSTELRLIDEMIIILGSLDKYCTDECKTCGGETIQTDFSAQENFNFDDIIVNVDGGNI